MATAPSRASTALTVIRYSSRSFLLLPMRWACDRTVKEMLIAAHSRASTVWDRDNYRCSERVLSSSHEKGYDCPVTYKCVKQHPMLGPGQRSLFGLRSGPFYCALFYGAFYCALF